MNGQQLRLDLQMELPQSEIAARICEDVAAQSRNHLFRSGAKICAGEIRRLMESKNAND